MKEIFEKYEYEGLQLRNRVVRAATNDYSGLENGIVSDLQFDLYKKLAEGKIGLIITGNFYVTDDGRLDFNQNSITKHWKMKNAEKLCEIVHEYGSKLVFQISHAGAKSKVCSESQYKYAEVNKLSQEEINKLIKDFIDATDRALDAKADGIQLHFGHGYLLNNILCQHNGGIKIAEKLFQGIRKKHKTVPLLVKVNTDTDMEIFEAFIRLCEQYGIWAIELSGSDFQKKKREETNYYMSSIETVKRLTDIPVIMTGGV